MTRALVLFVILQAKDSKIRNLQREKGMFQGT